MGRLFALYEVVLQQLPSYFCARKVVQLNETKIAHSYLLLIADFDSSFIFKFSYICWILVIYFLRFSFIVCMFELWTLNS